jgi:hypothetical protein
MIEARSAVIGSTIGRVGAVGGTVRIDYSAASLGDQKNRADSHRCDEREEMFHKSFIDGPDQRAFGLITETKGISRAPAGFRKEKSPALSHGLRFQLKNSTNTRGKFVRSVKVTASRQGNARWPDSIQTSQFTPGDRNARCWHGRPLTTAGPTTMPLISFRVNTS